MALVGPNVIFVPKRVLNVVDFDLGSLGLVVKIDKR